MNVGSRHLQQVIEQLLYIIQVNALINIDFADILSLFRTRGKFALGVVDGSSGANIHELVRQAIHHPLTSLTENYRATGILVFAEAGEDFDLENLTQATDFVNEITEEGTQVIFGMNTLPDNPPLRIIVLATGIKPIEKKFNSKGPFKDGRY